MRVTLTEAEARDLLRVVVHGAKWDETADEKFVERIERAVQKIRNGCKRPVVRPRKP